MATGVLSKYSDAEIKDYVNKNANDPNAIATGMQQYGVGIEDISRAGGWDPGTVSSYIKGSGNAYLKGQLATWDSRAAATRAAQQPAQQSTAAPMLMTPPGAINNSPQQMTTARAPAPPVLSTPPGSVNNSPQPAVPRVPGLATPPGTVNNSPQQYPSNPVAPVAPPPLPVAPAPKIDVSGVLGQAAGPTTYTPGENSLVSNQLSKLLASDSPYMQRARARAMETANARGLLNSSIAATAGEAAAIDASMPIAQADAGAFLGSQRDNTNAANDFSRQGNQFRFNSAGQEFQGVLQQQQQAREQAFNTGRDATQQGYNLARDATQNQFNAGQADKRDQFSLARDAIQNQYTNQRTDQQNQFTSSRDTVAFDRRVQETRTQTEADIARVDAANKTNTLKDYQKAAQSTYDTYVTEANKIQQSDMDPDVKSAQVASLQSLFESRQTYLNSVFKSSPQWAKEWSQVALEFGGP